jgi:hypothetical protein
VFGHFDSPEALVIGPYTELERGYKERMAMLSPVRRFGRREWRGIKGCGSRQS